MKEVYFNTRKENNLNKVPRFCEFNPVEKFRSNFASRQTFS